MNGYIWVTGGAGYIGSHACKLIAAKTDFVPVAVDDLSEGRADLVKWGPLAPADITDPASLTAVARAYPPYAVMHFAAKTSVELSMKHPDEYWHTNVTGTKVLLDAMMSAGCKRLIFSSSASVYGSPEDSVSIKETHALAPMSVYGETKRVDEEMIKSYAHSFGLMYAMMRYFNVAGADPEAETGRARGFESETMLLPRMIAAALGNKHAEIYGTDYPTPDGTCVRDYIHVSDIASAHIAALDKIDDLGHEIFNLGSGSGMSVMEIVLACERVLGITFDKALKGRREGDPAFLTADPSKALRLLGWKTSELSGADRLIQTAYDWARKISKK